MSERIQDPEIEILLSSIAHLFLRISDEGIMNGLCIPLESKDTGNSILATVIKA